jgi:phenylpropionate dioxygenase-like ring-hydroxylating dioxygenase large terminal subunit
MADLASATKWEKISPQPRDVFENMLRGRKHVPALSDGTTLRDLVNIDKREVMLRTYDDPELHRLEMDRIWSKVWVPICHETDLPNVGDYKRGYLGSDNVIVTRAADRSINVLLNVCAHRGMEVCWSDEGNARQFKCPYHGWVFDLKGCLLGAPFEREEYGDWDKSQFPLTAAKVACRHGIYFATFNQNPPPLESYLTEFKGFFDLLFGSHGMVSIDGREFGFSMDDLIPGGVIAANWKALAVQNVGDGYHSVTLHRSLVEQGMMRGGDAKGFALENSYDTSSTGGHGVRIVEVDASVYGVAGAESPFPLGRHIVGSLFPSCNISLNARMVETNSGRKILMWVASIGTRAPKGPGEAIESGFGLTAMNVEALEAIRSGELSLSTRGGRPFDFGIASAADDPESWMSQTRSARGAASRRQTIKYNALKGASYTPELPPGLGIVAPGFGKDDNGWWFWLAYYDWMTRD